MTVSELMHRNVQAVRVDDLLPAVVDAMADQHITAVAVLDQHGSIVGVVSTADVLTAQAESQETPAAWRKMAVEDVMTVPPITIGADATITEAAQALLYADVHRLFVVERNKAVGVISQTDIVRAFAAHRLH